MCEAPSPRRGSRCVPAARLARPVLHLPNVRLRIPTEPLLHLARHAVRAEVDVEAVVAPLLELLRVGPHEPRVALAVEDTHREDEEGVDAEDPIEELDALREAAERRDALLDDVRVHARLADDGTLEEFEQRDLGRAEPAPEHAVHRVVGEGDHVLNLPEDRPVMAGAAAG